MKSPLLQSAPLLMPVVLWGCVAADAPAVTAEQIIPVRVAEVELALLDVSMRAVGTVAPRDQVRLSFKTPGVVATVDVDEGDVVRRGQVLAALEQAEIDASLRQARAAADKAARDLERARALFADAVATKEQVQDLTTALQVARATLDTAEFNARFTRIEAPADGVVLRRLAEPRELVAAGQPLLVLGMTGGGWVIRASLADRDVVRVRAGDPAVVALDAYPQQEVVGEVSRVAAAADPATGTYEMEVAVDAGDLHLVQGLVARVQVRDGREQARPVVPLTALLEADRGSAVVFLVDAQHMVARRADVVTGRFAGDRIEIAEGVQAGDRVVIDGAAYLRDGDAVRVLPPG